MIGRTALLAAAVLSLPIVCAAQSTPDTPSPDDKVANVKFGPVTIQPSLVVHDVGEDHNVFNEASNPQSDFTFTLTPKAVIIFKAGPFRTTYKQNTDYVYFKKFKSERGSSQINDVRAELAVGPITPFVGFSDNNAKSRVDNEVDTRARHDERQYSTGATLKLFTRTVASVTARQSTVTFNDNEIFRGQSLAEAFDGKTTAADGSVGVTLTPFTTASFVVSKEQQRFDRAPERNSDTLRLMPTLAFSPLGLINGTAAFGYRKFTPKDPATPDFKGFVALATVGVTLFDHHHFDAIVVRDLTYSYDEAATYFIQNSVGLTWTYAFAGPLDLKLGATRNLMRYHRTATSPGGDDRFANFTGGLGYRIRKRLHIGIDGDFNSRRSTIAADRAFNNNRVYGTLTWGG
jgi:hypothetical protein